MCIATRKVATAKVACVKEKRKKGVKALGVNDTTFWIYGFRYLFSSRDIILPNFLYNHFNKSCSNSIVFLRSIFIRFRYAETCFSLSRCFSSYEETLYESDYVVLQRIEVSGDLC